MKSFVVATLATVLIAGVAGCQSSESARNVSFEKISGDLTPELAGLVDRPVDIDRHTAVMSNMNMRMFWDDVSRALYIDHPSRLSPHPIIYTSGNPR